MANLERRQLLQPTEDLFETFRAPKFDNSVVEANSSNVSDQRRSHASPGYYAQNGAALIGQHGLTESPKYHPEVSSLDSQSLTQPLNYHNATEQSTIETNMMMLTMDSPFELPKSSSTNVLSSEVDFDFLRTSVDNLFTVFDLPHEWSTSPASSIRGPISNKSHKSQSPHFISAKKDTTSSGSPTRLTVTVSNAKGGVAFAKQSRSPSPRKADESKVAFQVPNAGPPSSPSTSPRSAPRTLSRSHSFNASSSSKIVASNKGSSNSVEAPPRLNLSHPTSVPQTNETKANAKSSATREKIGVKLAIPSPSASNSVVSSAPTTKNLSAAKNSEDIKTKRKSHGPSEKHKRAVSAALAAKALETSSAKRMYPRSHSQSVSVSEIPFNKSSSSPQKVGSSTNYETTSTFSKSNSTPTLPSVEAGPNTHIKIGQKAGRAAIINEMLETERSYMRDLQTIIDIYKKPIQQTNVIPEEAIGTIFANIEMILTISDEFLRDLECLIKLPDNQQCIGKIFVDKAQFLKGYKLYCANFTLAQQTLKKLKDEVPAFAEFLEKQTQSHIKGGLSIFDFIIKPVQRVCKYPLFLMELFKHTPQEHPDFVHLRQALQIITKIVTEINETKRFQENQAKLMQIQQSFVQTNWGDEPLNIMHPQRVLVKEGELKCLKKGKAKKYYYYQFNDLFLFGTLTKGKYSLSRMFRFSELVLQQQQDKPNIVEFTCGDEKYMLELAVPADKNIFLTGVTKQKLENSPGVTL